MAKHKYKFNPESLRITSYNVCYTKLLRPWQPGSVDGMPATKTIELRIKLEARRE